MNNNINNKLIYCTTCDEYVTVSVNEDGEKDILCSSFYCPIKEEYGSNEGYEELNFEE